MNKNAIKEYAVWARNELITQIKQRAFQYGISESDYGDVNANVIDGRVLSNEEQKQRKEFIDKIKDSNYQQAVEEVAYIWFNRLIALRYMEVNDYLPTHTRVFSDATGAFNPEILSDFLHLNLTDLEKAKVSELLNANKRDDLYRYLLLTQCNALNKLLPEMFEHMGAYTEMLLPNNILKPDGVIGRLVNDIPEEDFRDAVQIIGWLYQYYNTEPKQAVKNIKISRENIPAATQLFTPDWIVRYMVENSLGRLWLESHPNSSLKANWKYYIDEAKQTPEVEERLRILRSKSAIKSPEDIKFMDPCMGSGHILVYAFDILMQIYLSQGYTERDAAQLILEKNLYGLDIDRRAYQLAYFALMMKARKYNRRILTLGVQPQIYEPSGYEDGMEYGSLIRVDKLEDQPEKPKEKLIFDIDYDTKLKTWNFRRLLAQKYDVVVTNPPYMGNKGLNDKISKYLKDNYSDYKGDTFSAFIIRCGEMTKASGYVGMFSPFVWMFIQNYEKLRKNLYKTKNITTLIQFEYSAFKEATVPVCAFVYRNSHTGEKGYYFRLTDFRGGMEIQQQKYLEAIDNPNCGYLYIASTDNFAKIPGSPVAYWMKKYDIFDFEQFGNGYQSGSRNKTHNNEKYVRYWWEIEDRVRFAPYANGGDYKKWYGNHFNLVDWSESAKAEYNSHGGLYNKIFWGRQGVCWNLITSAQNGFRIKPSEFHYSSGSPTLISDNPTMDLQKLGFLNTKVAGYLLKAFNPTLNTTVTDIMSLPYNIGNEQCTVMQIVTENISLSRTDWDSFETSWDFTRHPLICGDRTVAEAFAKWEREAAQRFDTLKANEEELNRIFIDIYGLQDELTPEVDDKNVTVRRADLGREIRSLISFAVGCMFGRYSLDIQGLAFAGGTFDMTKYKTFPADRDNIIPVCDDEYFDDDITGRFVAFVNTVYGADTLEENLNFIAGTLDGKGTASRDVIRNYFLNDFYKDHLKIYQKRPIYWLFDSGKENGFKALIYMHRYQSDLLARMRTDYVHEQQERYRTQLSHIVDALNNATDTERVRLLEQQDKLSEQAAEIAKYEEKIHHLADRNIKIDLDDGVKHNYEMFTDVLAKI